MLQERNSFVQRIDDRHFEMREADFDRQARKSRSRTDISDTSRLIDIRIERQRYRIIEMLLIYRFPLRNAG
ncbi:hypothetical protein D3C84_1145540 [compost metagenome]